MMEDEEEGEKSRKRKETAYIRRCAWCLCWFGTPNKNDEFCCPRHRRLFKEFEQDKRRDL